LLRRIHLNFREEFMANADPTPEATDKMTKVVTLVNEGQIIAGAILAAIPATAAIAPLEALLEQWVVKSLLALQAAKDTPITVDSVMALMPDQAPLV
jgi:hypothetical protein